MLWGQFYTKVDPDGKGIENVTFQVKDGDAVLYFVKQNDGPYKKAASAATSDATPDVKTDANGKLTFTGLNAAKVAEGSRLTGDFVAL
ncbi:SpaA isopeptide-forming pilin-related protein [Bifidobacterium pseudocatenulatum]